MTSPQPPDPKAHPFTKLFVHYRNRMIPKMSAKDFAFLVGVTGRAVQYWEAGDAFPSRNPEKLKAVISVFLATKAFTPASEAEEAEALWNSIASVYFDRRWFNSLLTRQARGENLLEVLIDRARQQEVLENGDNSGSDTTTITNVSNGNGDEEEDQHQSDAKSDTATNEIESQLLPEKEVESTSSETDKSSDEGQHTSTSETVAAEIGEPKQSSEEDSQAATKVPSEITDPSRPMLQPGIPRLARREMRFALGGLLLLALLIGAIVMLTGSSGNKGPNQQAGVSSSLPAATTISTASTTSALVPTLPLTAVPVTTIVPTASTPTATTPTVLSAATLCSESSRKTAPDADRFLRNQGVSNFSRENTDGAVINNKVRAIALDARGLWIGYFATAQNAANGLGQYDKKTWAVCNQPGDGAGKNINAIVVDRNGTLWLGTEKGGVVSFDGKAWQTYTTREGLPSNEIFGLTVDEKNNVWAATWEGVAKFDGNTWTAPYTAQKDTIFSNHSHAIVFDSTGDVWVGHIGYGVSRYDSRNQKWVHYTAETGELGGNEIHSAVIRPGKGTEAESIWFATVDGGVSKFEQGKWTTYRTQDGLPSNYANAVAVDQYNRVWVATDKGVIYLEQGRWITYTTLNTFSIAVGASCQTCPFEANDHIWLGTAEMGLTHSRLPYPDSAVDITEVCFISTTREQLCQTVATPNTGSATPLVIKYPKILAPGEQFRLAVTVRPRATYQLREDRGDFLSNTDASDANLFGAWVHMPVKGTIEPGQPFTFTDYDKLFTAPQLGPGETEKTFTSTWRVWLRTRYTGPYVTITFTVRK